jgi:hypothetical protein
MSHSLMDRSSSTSASTSTIEWHASCCARAKSLAAFKCSCLACGRAHVRQRARTRVWRQRVRTLQRLRHTCTSNSTCVCLCQTSGTRTFTIFVVDLVFRDAPSVAMVCARRFRACRASYARIRFSCTIQHSSHAADGDRRARAGMAQASRGASPHTAQAPEDTPGRLQSAAATHR